MKMIKGAVIVFIGLFIVLTLLSLLIPSTIANAKAVSVHADSIRLFNEISDLKNWNHWHPAFKNDSTVLKLGNVSDKINASATWMQNTKEYKLVIVEKNYPYVKINLQSKGEKDMENILSVMPVMEQGNMQVQWQSVTHLKWYPWEKFSGIFMEKMAGAGNEEALNSLKVFVENTK
jgi:hypothetical protein